MENWQGARWSSWLFLLFIGVSCGCRRTNSSRSTFDVRPAQPIEIHTGALSDDMRDSTVYTLKQVGIRSTLTLTHYKDPRTNPELIYTSFADQDHESCATVQPASNQLAKFPDLFKMLTQKQGAEQRYSLLFNCYNEVDDRLPAIAMRNPEWAAELKRPYTSRTLEFVAKLLNESNAFPELRSSLLSVGYDVHVDAGGLEGLREDHAWHVTARQRALLPGTFDESEIVPVHVSRYFRLERQLNAGF